MPLLDTLLNAEIALFFKAFQKLDIPSKEYQNAQPLPTALAMANSMLRVAYEGSFDEVVTTLLVTEWTYYDLAIRSLLPIINRQGEASCPGRL